MASLDTSRVLWLLCLSGPWGWGNHIERSSVEGHVWVLRGMLALQMLTQPRSLKVLNNCIQSLAEACTTDPISWPDSCLKQRELAKFSSTQYSIPDTDMPLVDGKGSLSAQQHGGSVGLATVQEKRAQVLQGWALATRPASCSAGYSTPTYHSAQVYGCTGVAGLGEKGCLL